MKKVTAPCTSEYESQSQCKISCFCRASSFFFLNNIDNVPLKTLAFNKIYTSHPTGSRNGRYAWLLPDHQLSAFISLACSHGFVLILSCFLCWKRGRRDLEYFADGIKNVDVLLVIVQENDVTGG